MSRLMTLIAASIMILPSFSASSEVDFLVPGVSLREVDLTPGSSVSYLVVSEAHGIRDSSLVVLSVTADEEGRTGMEISSSSWPPVEDETVTVRLTLCREAAAMSGPEDFHSCVSGILVSRGGDPFRAPEPEEIEDFDIGRLFLRRLGELEHRELPSERVTVPAGEFDCSVEEYSRSVTRQVDMGGITAERSESELSVLRIAPEVPFWGLVSSRVERSSRTSYPGGRRPREARPRKTVTESVLVEYSFR